MAIELYEHQKAAIEMLKSGSILKGGVGSGKSRTALGYYFTKECKGKIKTNQEGGFSAMKTPMDLYIITTAKKRDSLEWEEECVPFLLSTKPELSICGVKVVIDSWENIKKYIHVKNAFFIFDEQKIGGNGVWVNSFLKIAQINPKTGKSPNKWVVLAAIPGDTWMNYVPMFIANGFYKNRTEFIRRHVIYNSFSKFPKIDRYVEVGKLIEYRDRITVNMKFKRHTISHVKKIFVNFSKELLNTVMVRRWNPWKERPVTTVGELCYLLRKAVNIDPSRLEAVKEQLNKHPRLILFYNFDYELEMLRVLAEELKIPFSEWNGHRHQLIPDTDKWLYIVQYTSGAEAWNCITTNAILFYSQNYSYKINIQAAGRIDRANTPFIDLFYYHLISNSSIDMAIQKSLKNKQNFNELRFLNI